MSVPIRPHLKSRSQEGGTGLTCFSPAARLMGAATLWGQLCREASPSGVSKPQVHTRKPSSGAWVPTLSVVGLLGDRGLSLPYLSSGPHEPAQNGSSRERDKLQGPILQEAFLFPISDMASTSP